MEVMTDGGVVVEVVDEVVGIMNSEEVLEDVVGSSEEVLVSVGKVEVVGRSVVVGMVVGGEKVVSVVGMVELEPDILASFFTKSPGRHDGELG